MVETQEGALIGQSIIPANQTGEVTEQRHVVQRLRHRRVAQSEPLLHELDAKQRFDWERWAVTFDIRRVGRDQRYQPNQDTTRSISSRNYRRRVRFVDAPNPRLACFMVLGNQAGAEHMFARLIQPFLKSQIVSSCISNYYF